MQRNKKAPGKRDGARQRAARHPEHARVVVQESAAGTVERVRCRTKAQLEALLESEAHEMLGVPAKEAFRMLDEGELHGTAAESELKALRALRWM